MNELIEKMIDSILECAKVAHDNDEYEREQGYLDAIECIKEELAAQKN